ncbi:hypothetical protein GGI35DRAFT_477428 [Trichoderma velutinum]
MDPGSSREKFHNESLKNLGATVIFAAEVAHDSGKYDTRTGRYYFSIQKLSNKLQHRNDTRQDPDAFEQIPEAKRSELTKFHDEVVRPLVNWLLDESKRGDIAEAGPTRMDYYSAFYHYQSACNMTARYLRDEQSCCKDRDITGFDFNGHIKTIQMIPATLCGESERRALGEVVGWVNIHYRKLIAKARTTYPADSPESSEQTLCNLLAVHGLRHLQQYCLHDKLDMGKLVEADNRAKKGLGMPDSYVLAALEAYIDA